MSYNIIPTDNFNREAKHLAKKYYTLKNDLLSLRAELQENPNLGTPLGKGVFKICLAIGSKGKGKSGGAGVISFVYLIHNQIFLLAIYDKSEKDNVTNEEIKSYLKGLPF
jgi:hypothetical protein